MAPAVSAPASPRHSTQCLLLPTRDDSSLPLHAHDDVDDHAEVTQSSKIKSLLGILKKVVGVKDLAAIRLSLPSHLIEPVVRLSSAPLRQGRTCRTLCADASALPAKPRVLDVL